MAEEKVDIFAAIEEAGDKDKESKKVDLGPISRMVEVQAMLEAKADTDLVRRLNKVIKDYKISIGTIQECLKDRNKELYRVRQQQIPEMMKEFGLDALKTTDGTSIKIMGDISVTKKDEQKLFKYLRANKAGDLIKNQVIVSVEDNGEREEVIEALDNTSCCYVAKETIHAGTLKKHIKSLQKEGKQIPEDAVAVFNYEYSKIK